MGEIWWNCWKICWFFPSQSRLKFKAASSPLLAQYWQNVLSEIYREDKVKNLKANSKKAVKEQIQKAKRELKKAIKEFSFSYFFSSEKKRRLKALVQIEEDERQKEKIQV